MASILFDCTIKNVKTYDAIEVGQRYCTYIREIDVKSYIESNLSKLKKKIDDEDFISSLKTIDQWLAAFDKYGQKNGLISLAIHSPLDVNLDQSMVDVSERDTADFPKRLTIVYAVPSNTNKFYILNDELIYGKNQKRLTYIVLITLSILVLCLFPAWPFIGKLISWYILYSICVGFTALLIFRLVLFIALWFVGINFWLFPNLLDEELSVIDSFKPLASFAKEKLTTAVVAIRAVCFMLICASIYKLQETRQLSNITDTTTKLLIDVFEWGKDKIANNSTDIMYSTIDDKLLTPAERLNRNWDICVKYCDFEDFAEFTDFCYDDCACLSELKNSKCTRKCTIDVNEDLVNKLNNCNF